MRHFSALAILSLFTITAHAADKSQPRSLDPELKIELFAEHPTLVTPTGIDVDYKGRVFAVESNTHFPPSGYKGHPTDRVLVLQDTNGDGKADKTTVFTDGLTHTMSVKVAPLWLQMSKSGNGKAESGGKAKPAFRSPLSAFVATRRDIWLYHDTNGDLKADGRKQIVHLETKGNYPHNGLAGITFDAMGWMYFGFGENLGADYTIIGSDGTKLSGGGEGGNMYRCRPDGTKLTKWATGFWNPHASCVDAFGRLFTVDNDPDSRPPCRLLHIIEGGDYGFRFRNGRKGLHPFTAWNGEIPGTLPMVAGTGEAPSGIIAYESDGLPKKYIGNLLVGSWGDHRIDRFVLKPKGASFVSRAEPLIQGGEDFRPVGLAVAPDGSIFCTDWVKRDYKLHGHGRVWRISRKKRPKSKVIDLATITPKRPIKELTALLSHPRLDVRRMAARTLLLSKDKGWSAISDVMDSPKASEKAKAECLYLAVLSKGIEGYVIDRQVLSEMTTMNRGLFDVLMTVWDHMLGKEKKEVVAKFDSPFLRMLLKTGKDADDVRARQRFEETMSWIPLHQSMNWNARVGKDGTTTLKAVTKLATIGDPFQISSMITVFDKSDSERFLDTILTTPSSPPELVNLALLAIRAKKPTKKKHLETALKSTSPDVRRVAVQWVAEENLKDLKPQVEAVLNGKVMNTDLFLATLAALEMLDGKRPQDFDKTPAGKYVLPIVKDAKRPATVRAIALRLVDPDDKSLNEKLFAELLASNESDLKLEAIRTLQHGSSQTAIKLLPAVIQDSKVDVSMRADAIAALGSFLPQLPESHATRQAVQQLTDSKNRTLRFAAMQSLRGAKFNTGKALKRVVAYLNARKKAGGIKGDDREIVLQMVRMYRTVPHAMQALALSLPGGSLRPETPKDWFEASKLGGDIGRGRRVFFHANSAGCYKCHTVNGRGGKIGPDLSYIARTANRRKLAESILEPSKEIAPQYTLWSFVMASGKVHHGTILGDTRNGKRQQIGTPEGRIVELPLLEIEERLPQSKSVMPDKLIDRLTATEFRDLLAFLESLK